MERGRTLDTTGLGSAATLPFDPDSAGQTPSPTGITFGRYQLERVLGEGGMGVVWAAHDRELGRMVALKLLRPTLASADAELRLRREAQAMARLAHPNVIRVYDVGVADGKLFVAMEYVVGGTLKEWTSQKPRSVDEILAVFAQVARGLAAAHDLGLIHRDVKPSNVMVGDDGQVFVTDFGLARFAAEHDQVPHTATAVSDPELFRTITRTGGIVGTPAFMAPEQLLGAPVDERADQFSFCVSLWRALYRTAPFAGKSLGELVDTVTTGTLTPPPDDAGVPAYLRAVLERGLARDPRARFASMHELLEALTTDPDERRRHRRRRIATRLSLAALGVAAVAIAGVTWRLGRQAALDAPCDAAGDRFANVWDASVRDRLGREARALGKPFAVRSFEEVARQLDRARSAWEGMRRQNCEATRVHKVQSDTAMDLRAACLERRFDELASFVALLGQPSPELLASAPERAASVGDVSACADVTALARRLPVLADPDRRTAIATLERELATHRTALESERRVDRTIIDAAVTRAEAFAYPPLTAEALYVAALDRSLAKELAEARRTLDAALLEAEAGGDDLLRFQIEAALARVTGADLEQFEDGIRYGEHAHALLKRLGEHTRQDESLLLETMARIRWRQGKLDDALDLATRALALAEAIDKHGVATANRLWTLAIVHSERDEAEASLRHIERALAIVTQALGPDHPKIARMLQTRGGNFRRLDRLAEAEADYQRSLAIFRASLGEDVGEVGTVYTNLGSLYDKRGDHAAAVEQQRRAVAIYERVFGPDHARTLVARERLGGTLSKAGHAEEAVATLRQVIDGQRRAVGADHPWSSNAHFHLGMHYLRRAKQPALALPELEEARRAMTASQGPRAKLLARIHSAIGDTYLALDRPADAVASFEDGIACAGDDEARRAGLEHALAEALLAANQRTRARGVAETARRRYLALGDRAKEDLADLDAWIAEHWPPRPRR